MKKNKATALLFTIVTLLAFNSYAQDYSTKKSFKKTRFSIKLVNGYSLTNAGSKLQIVQGNYAMGNAVTTGLSLAWNYNSNWSIAISATTGKYTLAMENGDYTNIDMYRKKMDLGAVWMAPLSLSVAYHLTSDKNIIPYAIAGGTYVLFSNVDPGWGASAISYQNRPAFHLGIGADHALNKHWFVSAEIRKYLMDNSNVNLDFKVLKWNLETQLKADPINITVGIGYRFYS
ncbi:MAG: hypothetical protein COB98_10990 [Flavobacteriaceae bacterium]|nr:MAG: hypothetical protein COB98_10990 [Flavobacteriaceae bacterium]